MRGAAAAGAERLKAALPKLGDRVRITGVKGTVYGIVESIAPPAALPPIPGVDVDVRQATAILEEWAVDHVAMLSYPYGSEGQRLVFAALHTRGEWRDLQGQLLEIEPVRLQ